MKSGFRLVLLLSSLPVALCTVKPLALADESQNHHPQRIYGEDMLRPEQIRECLQLRAGLVEREAALSKEEKRLKTQAANVQRMGNRLMAEQKQLDARDLEALSSFQAELSLYTRAEDEYNDRALRYNKALDRFRQDQQRFNNQCADKRYYDDEYQAALNALNEHDARLLIKEGRGSGLVADRAVKAPVVKASATEAKPVGNPPAQKTDEQAGVFVQLGAFRQQQSIDEVKKIIGDAYALSLWHTSSGLTIVRAGPFDSRQAAEEARRDIAQRFHVEGFVRVFR